MSQKRSGCATGVLFAFFLVSEAVSPLDRMGSLPMSEIVMVGAHVALMLFAMFVILRKPVHFWRSSEVR